MIGVEVADPFRIEVETIRDLTQTEADMAAGGLAADQHTTTWWTTTTFTAVPGTEWTVATITTMVG